MKLVSLSLSLCSLLTECDLKVNLKLLTINRTVFSLRVKSIASWSTVECVRSE